MSEVENTLQKRGNVHGNFSDSSKLCQALKDLVRDMYPQEWSELDADMKESFDMIFHKMVRILLGDSTFPDHWHDIQGYAKLIEDRLNKPVKM